MARPAPFLPLLLALPALAACTADQARYPSLTIRAAERVTGAFEPVAPTPQPAAPAPASTADLAALRTQAASAHGGFMAAIADTTAKVAAARGAEEGSEAWAQAQVALARLETSRGDAMIALADLDRIYVAGQLAAADTSAVEAVRSDVSAMVAEEERQIDSLYALLGN